MTPWPRTLLWRSVLLIAAVLIVAHLAWLQIFRASEVEPRALQAAQQLVSVVNLTRAALVTAEPARRFASGRATMTSSGWRRWRKPASATCRVFPFV